MLSVEIRRRPFNIFNVLQTFVELRPIPFINMQQIERQKKASIYPGFNKSTYQQMLNAVALCIVKEISNSKSEGSQVDGNPNRRLL